MLDEVRRRDFRQTKIVCTLGPASSSPERLREMAAAGMNVARLNMSHGSHESHAALIQVIKRLNGELSHPIAILLDTQGPEIRTGDRPEKLELSRGDRVVLTVDEQEAKDSSTIFVNYPDLVALEVGSRITLDNGIINVVVLSRAPTHLVCEVLDGGSVGSRRHVNLPGLRVNLPSITEKDVADIQFGLKHDVDFIALSFVRDPSDLRECRKLVEAAEKHTRLYAKIENHEGVEFFDEILEEADGIMVARGDLGVEIEISGLPMAQRSMLQQCVLKGKPTIIATHLLESMIENPTPTRAEVSDVANAVYEGADAIMLSGETSAGKYPVRCIEIMDSIARRMEKEKSIGFHLERGCGEVREHLARAACKLADSLGSRAIIVTSHSGRLVQQVASYRPTTAMIYGFTDDEAVLRQLWAVRSVVPLLARFNEEKPEESVYRALRELQRRNRLLSGDPVVIVSDIQVGSERVEVLQVRTFDVV